MRVFNLCNLTKSRQFAAMTRQHRTPIRNRRRLKPILARAAATVSRIEHSQMEEAMNNGDVSTRPGLLWILLSSVEFLISNALILFIATASEEEKDTTKFKKAMDSIACASGQGTVSLYVA